MNQTAQTLSYIRESSFFKEAIFDESKEMWFFSGPSLTLRVRVEVIGVMTRFNRIILMSSQ